MLGQLKAEGFFDGAKSVIDFGPQEIKCLYRAPTMKKCLDQFGVLENLTEKKLADICNGPARNFFEAVGIKYTCIDINDEEGVSFFDLNFDSVKPSDMKAYDLMLNVGTVEHVFNQYNAFKAAHDFVRKGGHFIHFMPFLGYIDHGYYSFQPGLYIDLAAANDYEILGMWINPDGRHDHYLIPWDTNVLKHLDLKATNHTALMVIMRKNGEGEFKVPFQGRYAGNYVGDFSARYTSIAGAGEMGAVSRQSLIDGLSGDILQRALIKRYLKNMKRILFGWMR
jgi:hypothetical protein